MPDIELKLRQEEAKLVFLAIAYHLGRPGSELDPITKQTVAHGLAETARELQPQLRDATASVQLNSLQLTRLLSGMLGSVTELKAYPMLQPRGMDEGAPRRSTVPGFDRSLLHLFPAIEQEPEISLEVAEHMVMLKRRLDERVAQLPPDPPPDTPKKRAWWPFGR